MNINENLSPTARGTDSPKLGVRPFKNPQTLNTLSSSDEFSVSKLKKEFQTNAKGKNGKAGDWRQKQDRMELYNLQKRFK